MVLITPKYAHQYHRVLRNDPKVVVEYIPIDKYDPVYRKYQHVLPTLSSQFGGITFMRVDVDSLKVWANRAGVWKKVPSYIFWKDGMQHDRFEMRHVWRPGPRIMSRAFATRKFLNKRTVLYKKMIEADKVIGFLSKMVAMFEDL